MNLQNLTQKQKQQLVAGAIVVVGIGYAAIQFGWKPFAARRAAAETELTDLKLKIEKAVQAGKNEAIMAEKLRESRRGMSHIAREFVPASDNALSWVTKTIYAQARKVGVNIESIAETGDAAVEFTAKEQDARAFKPYGVMISMRCSYAKLVRLLQAFEAHNPYILVSSINITTSESKESHAITINVQWPIWKDTEKGLKMESLPEEDGEPTEPQSPAEGTTDA